MNAFSILWRKNWQSFLWDSAKIHQSTLAQCGLYLCQNAWHIFTSPSQVQVLHKIEISKSYTTSCDSTHNCLCKWWIFTKRPSASQEMSSSFLRRRGNTEDKPNQTLELSFLMYIYSTSLGFKKFKNVSKNAKYLWSPPLSIMQTDNYVYFFLAIDIYMVYLMNITDSIKDKCVPTRMLCGCSLVCNLSVWYFYSLSYLHWH